MRWCGLALPGRPGVGLAASGCGSRCWTPPPTCSAQRVPDHRLVTCDDWSPERSLQRRDDLCSLSVPLSVPAEL